MKFFAQAAWPIITSGTAPFATRKPLLGPADPGHGRGEAPTENLVEG